MSAKLHELLERAHADTANAWFGIRRAMELVSDVSPKLTDEAIEALEATEEFRDRLRKALAVLDGL